METGLLESVPHARLVPPRIIELESRKDLSYYFLGSDTRHEIDCAF